MRRRDIAEEICDDAWISAAYRRRLAMLKHLHNAVRSAAHHPNNHTEDQTTPANTLPTSRTTIARRVSGTSTPAERQPHHLHYRRVGHARRLRADPGHLAGDGPDQNTSISIVSLNVTALEANWPTCNSSNVTKPTSWPCKRRGIPEPLCQPTSATLPPLTAVATTASGANPPLQASPRAKGETEARTT